MTNVVSIVEYRAKQTPLQEALAAVKHHRGLRDIDKAAIARLSRYATDQGFFDLDQRERGAVTGLKKFHLMSGLARVKKVGLLHKADCWRLHRIGEIPTEGTVQTAERLFAIHRGLKSLWLTLKDTDTQDYEASWLVPKIWSWSRGVTEKELTAAAQELGRLGYLAVVQVCEGDKGTATIRYRPAEYPDFCKRWIPEGEPA